MAQDITGIPRDTRETDPMAQLLNKIQALSSRLDILERGAPQRSMSISGGGGLTINDGGMLTVNGSAKITGTLELPAGIIGNEALASPVTVDSTSIQQNSFALTTTDQDFASGSIPIPAGFTQALVFIVGSAAAINSSASPDYLRAKAVVNGVASREMFGYAGPTGGSTALTVAKSSFLTGLSGGSISVAVRLHTQGSAWATDASNRAYVEAQAIFLR